MIRNIALALTLALALPACSEPPAGEPVVRSRLDGKKDDSLPRKSAAGNSASACRDVTFEQVPLTVCTAEPAKHRIAMVNAPKGGKPYGSLGAFAGTVDEAGIAFAMNGGMYGDDLKPVGYYVENGERLVELDRSNGPDGNDANFYMKPNGVFFGNAGGGWQVMGSNTFFDKVGDRPQFGTQSGPLLLIDGKLHPEIQDNGPSRAIRNGVGVDAQGRAQFVISNAAISFGQLARFFRDELKVKTALYLDGQVSALWDPASGRQDTSRVGPIIVVTRKGAAE